MGRKKGPPRVVLVKGEYYFKFWDYLANRVRRVSCAAEDCGPPFPKKAWPKLRANWLRERERQDIIDQASLLGMVAVEPAQQTRRSTRPQLPRSVREEVLYRDRYTCQYCGHKPPLEYLQIDHFVPVAKGGTDAPDNLRASCMHCNSRKGKRRPTPELLAQLRAEGTAHHEYQSRVEADARTRQAERGSNA